jgi:L-aspartate oxidase
LEGLVFAERIAETIERNIAGDTVPDTARSTAEDAAGNTARRTRDAPASTSTRTVAPLLPPEARSTIQRVMTGGAGVLRSASSLAGAAAELDALPADTAHKPADPGVETWETANLHLVARVLVTAALRRTETRGCHWREDHPDRDDAVWRRHIVVRGVGLRDEGEEPGRSLDVRTTDTTAFPQTLPPTHTEKP